METNRLLALAATAASLTTLPAWAAPKCPAEPGVVATQQGCLRGVSENGVTAYRGIPYAAAPVGPLRFKPPEPGPKWADVRDAAQFGKGCPQAKSKLSGDVEQSEDCLFLNVWTGAKPAARLPVMVWIHGGGLVQGASSIPWYDGSHFASHGVVLVSINYRLGFLGFLAHPALSAESGGGAMSGNYGLLDQIAALHWVQSNIAAFGGDPKRVTIFGESAGGESVCTLMASPDAAGLFSQAIIESGACVGVGSALRPLRGEAADAKETAEAQGVRLAEALDCKGEASAVAACLRSKTPAQILGAAKPKVGFFGAGEKFGFTLGSYALPEAPKARQDAGKLPHLPTMVGTTMDEGTLFAPRIKRWVGFEFFADRLYGDAAPGVLKLYPQSNFASPADAMALLVGDAIFTCSARQTARKLRDGEDRVYRYQFAHAPSWMTSWLGATHGTEIPFVFDTLDPKKANADEQRLAETMSAYWTQFAITGNPNGKGLPEWKKYDGKRDSYQKLALPISGETGLRTEACDFFDAHPLHSTQEEKTEE